MKLIQDRIKKIVDLGYWNGKKKDNNSISNRHKRYANLVVPSTHTSSVIRSATFIIIPLVIDQPSQIVVTSFRTGLYQDQICADTKACM